MLFPKNTSSSILTTTFLFKCATETSLRSHRKYLKPAIALRCGSAIQKADANHSARICNFAAIQLIFFCCSQFIQLHAALRLRARGYAAATSCPHPRSAVSRGKKSEAHAKAGVRELAEVAAAEYHEYGHVAIALRLGPNNLLYRRGGIKFLSLVRGLRPERGWGLSTRRHRLDLELFDARYISSSNIVLSSHHCIDPLRYPVPHCQTAAAHSHHAHQRC
jgi:hypothetical protein